MKKLLVDALIAAGIILQQQRNHTKKELQDFARKNGVDRFENKELVVPGWEGQPKGLMQVLRERGLIDIVVNTVKGGRQKESYHR